MEKLASIIAAANSTLRRIIYTGKLAPITNAAKSTIRRIIRTGKITPAGKSPKELNNTQALFCEWNAERLGISVAESRKRYDASWASIRGGFGGISYLRFGVLSHNLFRVFCDDNNHEIWEAYRFHGPMHMLAMLSYKEPILEGNSPIILNLHRKERVTILDFGCGLAQTSRAIAVHLNRSGVSVSLVLADIPTIRKDFLLWLGSKVGISISFLECTPEAPIPDLPTCDLCVATEVFEHLHDPLLYLHNMHQVLLPGGLLLTNIGNHDAEYMHVSPNLLSLRQELATLSYQELSRDTLYKKPEL
ncbi:MAG: class I SAM-dependent methyltransferase [Candidatus Electrothrix sp. ATG1]|nr:class I SAM-dependent methyltransferase [Candidatus Electrothrix sp. ATG1]